MDISFLIDIILTFFSEFEDEEQCRSVNTHREIALRYLKGWFFFDVFSIIPFELMLKGNQNANQFA